MKYKEAWEQAANLLEDRENMYKYSPQDVHILAEKILNDADKDFITFVEEPEEKSLIFIMDAEVANQLPAFTLVRDHFTGISGVLNDFIRGANTTQFWSYILEVRHPEFLGDFR